MVSIFRNVFHLSAHCEPSFLFVPHDVLTSFFRHDELNRYIDIRICEDSTLVQILFFWILSIVLPCLFFPKRSNNKQENFLDKIKMMGNVQKDNIFTRIFGYPKHLCH